MSKAFSQQTQRQAVAEASTSWEIGLPLISKLRGSVWTMGRHPG